MKKQPDPLFFIIAFVILALFLMYLLHGDDLLLFILFAIQGMYYVFIEVPLKGQFVPFYIEKDCCVMLRTFDNHQNISHTQ